MFFIFVFFSFTMDLCTLCVAFSLLTSVSVWFSVQFCIDIHIRRMLPPMLTRMKNTVFIMVETTLVSNPIKLQAKR